LKVGGTDCEWVVLVEIEVGEQNVLVGKEVGERVVLVEIEVIMVGEQIVLIEEQVVLVDVLVEEDKLGEVLLIGFSE
ncbi:15738_t:CDS:2, partial [Racocetra fulgida]